MLCNCAVAAAVQHFHARLQMGLPGGAGVASGEAQLVGGAALPAFDQRLFFKE